MAIRVILAKAHQIQLENEEIRRELISVQDELNKVDLIFNEDTINFVFIRGIYLHSERRMVTACLFVNKKNSSIKELHGSLSLKFKNNKAKIAKATVDFDEQFMGILNPNDALLVHFNIPIKGLNCDENFVFSDILGNFENVRITGS